MKLTPIQISELLDIIEEYVLPLGINDYEAHKMFDQLLNKILIDYGELERYCLDYSEYHGAKKMLREEPKFSEWLNSISEKK